MMLASRSKHLSEIKNDFERGVFLAVYDSKKQRFYRLLFIVVLCLKHILRGLLFSWPLYLLALTPTFMPADFWWMVMFVFPALYVSSLILKRGIREDYEKFVKGYVLSFQQKHR